MTSKVLVKMPEVPFSQVNNVKKANNELISSVGGSSSSSSSEMRSIAQLQENIRFLQAKHQIMLSRLHDEVDILRQKNRDLQFQLVFSKNSSPNASNTDETRAEVKVPTTENDEASPKDESNSDVHKKRCSQLEKELAATKVALQTSLARNAALQALLQKHKIPEIPWVQQQCGHAAAATATPVSPSELTASSSSLSRPQEPVATRSPPPESGEDSVRLQTRLDEAERLVRRLRAETDEQRREVLMAPATAATQQPLLVTSQGVTNLLFDSSPPAPIAARYLQSIKASLSAVGRGSGGGGGGRGGGGHRPGPLNQRFPPLQQPAQQAFWQQQQQQQQGPSQQREGNDYQGWNRGHRRNNDKVESGGIHGVGVNQSGLPDLRGNSQGNYNNGNFNGQQHQNAPRRGNHGYNNHYYRNSDRGGYRGNYREEDQQQQHKTYNTPADLSEGETEENSRNSYKHKRGQNKHHDKS